MSSNPFLPSKTNIFHPHSKHFKQIKFPSSHNANYPTKKRNKENILFNSISKEINNPSSKTDFSNLKQIPRKRQHYTSPRTHINTNIIFEEDKIHHKPFSVQTFPLYKDREIYSHNPFDEKIIPMKTDDDVMSDPELITNASNFLYNEITYAIITIQQHQMHSNKRIK